MVYNRERIRPAATAGRSQSQVPDLKTHYERKIEYEKQHCQEDGGQCDGCSALLCAEPAVYDLYLRTGAVARFRGVHPAAG